MRLDQIVMGITMGVLVMVGNGWGQSAPATAPVAPPIAPGTTLPAGHPAIGTIAPTTADGGVGTTTTLPSGHPPVGPAVENGGRQGMGMTTSGGGAATAAAGLAGTLNITVLAGSANPSSTANEAVTVELYRNGVPATKMELKTDSAGKLTVPNIPLMPPTDVIVSIHHAGLLQQAEAPALTLEAPTQSVEMKVFEPTEETPAWTVAMQHMIVEYAKDGTGAVVTEMLSTNNPADRAWIGAKIPGTGGMTDTRVTLTLPLPPEADKVELGGAFDEDNTHIVGGKLVTGSALFPGRSEFRVMYTMPVKNGTVELPIVTPAAVGSLIVMVPADETQVTATGLEGGQPVAMGQGQASIRMYRAQNLAAGAMVKLAIAGIKAAPAEADTGMPGTGWSGRNVAIGAAFLLVLAGAALMLMKKPKTEK